MDTFFLILELIGTVAFAVSGAAVAIRKEMDVFGVAILGTVTAVGGGIVRDLMLGLTPPMAFRDPVWRSWGWFPPCWCFSRLSDVRRCATDACPIPCC